MRFIELRRIHFTIHNQPCIHVHNVTTYDARTGASSAGFSFSVICMCDPRNNTWPFESICKTHGDDAVCSFYLRVIDMLRRRRPQHRTSSYPTSPSLSCSPSLTIQIIKFYQAPKLSKQRVRPRCLNVQRCTGNISLGCIKPKSSQYRPPVKLNSRNL